MYCDEVKLILNNSACLNEFRAHKIDIGSFRDKGPLVYVESVEQTINQYHFDANYAAAVIHILHVLRLCQSHDF